MNFLFWRRKNRDEELDEELQSHLRMAERDRVERGESATEAERAAHRQLGNMVLVKETTRDIWGWRWISDFAQDVRFGFRMLRKNPAFLATAVISLALGVGANTTVFSFLNALLFRGPAVKNQSELLELNQTDRRVSGLDGFSPISYPAYKFYLESNDVFSGLSAFDGEMRPTSWSHSGGGELIQGQLVSSNFFSVLGVTPVAGRDFLPDEGKVPATDLVVILNYGFWQRSMSGDRAAIGRTMTLNGKPFTVVGVAPENFFGAIIGTQPDYWTPLPSALALTNDRNYLESWNSNWLFGAGRLKNGVTPAVARANFAVISKRLQDEQPGSHNNIEAVIYPLQLVPTPVRGYVDAFGGLLMAIVGLVLLIACANTVNLVMANVAGRRRETAVRVALGASRARLIRQTLTESLLLAVLGGALGLTLAVYTVPLMLRLAPSNIPVRVDVPIDWRVVAFSAVISAVMCACIGLLPALRRSKLAPASALGDNRENAGPRQSRLRGALVVTQLSTCLLLLISAGLCVRSLVNAQSVDPGFDTRHTMLATMDPGSLGYSESQRTSFYRELLARVQSLTGVSNASLTAYLPLGTATRTGQILIEGRQPPKGQAGFNINTMYVGPGFFEAMAIPLLRGRVFDQSDVGVSPSPVVVNEAMAQRFWPGENALGQSLRDAGSKSSVNMIVVGVSATGKYRTLSERPTAVMYRLIGAMPQETLVVRTSGDPKFMLDSVRREISRADPNVVPINVETMKEYMNFPLFPARTAGILLATFGSLALVLAITGVYGVTSYAVGQRTHEIGVRVALGATRGDVLQLILRQGLGLTLWGIAIGIGAALGLTRVLSSLLYGISSTDITTFLVVPTLMAGVTLLACYVPARRALKVDPMVALRHE
jgi:predicted permease